MKYIRISQGTAATLGLINMKVQVPPTNAYLMLWHSEKCISNCQFCPQARKSSSDSRLLSRVLWPRFDVQELFDKFENSNISESFQRVCIQTINYPKMFDDLKIIIERLVSITKIPLSISSHPLTLNQLKELNEIGLERIGIPVDAATEELFDKIKGKSAKCPYEWNKHWNALRSAVKIFGEFRVSTHLIIGLGETEKEAVTFIQQAFDNKILTGLFTFTPIKGTGLANRKQPHYKQYRSVQLARYLIITQKSKLSSMQFDKSGSITNFGISDKELLATIKLGVPFQTSGCPGCNRPFYNERPGRELYNYPRKLSEDEIDNIIKMMKP
ncbi:MAG: radical SAM protein [Candidatus Helarchaeota archaeon]